MNYDVVAVKKAFVLIFCLALTLLIPLPVFAQSSEINLISFEFPEYKQPPGAQYFVTVTVFLDLKDVVFPQVITDKPFVYPRCKNCPISIKLENPQDSDSINQSDSKTDSDGRVSAKIVSNIFGKRIIYAEAIMPNRSTYKSNKYVLNYYEKSEMESTSALEQPAVVTQTVMPCDSCTIKDPKQSMPNPITTKSASFRNDSKKMPAISGVPVVTATIERSTNAPYSQSDELNKKVFELQKQLEESRKKQSVLEQRLNFIIDFIKSRFPFFR